jgi:hypothetical protein
MSRFRKHLESAKAEYEQIRYDGDLAADLLARVEAPRSRMNIARWVWTAGAVAAAAAMIVLVLRFGPPQISPNATSPDQIAVNATPTTLPSQTETPALAVVDWTDLPSMEVPDAPDSLDTRGTDEMSFAPSAPDFSFSVPSFSFYDDSEQQPSPNNSSKQESTL